MDLNLELGKRHLAIFLGSIAVLVALATTPQLLGNVVSDGVAGLSDASAVWLWIAAAGFAGSLVTSACGWQSALALCGGTTPRGDASARYCTGSIVNALAPARIGTAVRFALFSRVLHNEGRLWTVGGIAGSLSAVRALWLAVVLAIASAGGVLPRWPIALLLLGAGIAALIAWRARDSRPGTKLGHALDVDIGATALATLLLVVPLVAMVAATNWQALPDHLTSPTALDALRLSLVTSTVAIAFCLLLGLPLAWLLAHVLGWGPSGVFTAVADA